MSQFASPLLILHSALMIFGQGSAASQDQPAKRNSKQQTESNPRKYFENSLRGYYLVQYRAFLNKVEDPTRFLQEFELRWPRWRENELNLPIEVFNSYSYYLQNIQDKDIGSVRAYRVPMAKIEIYAIRVTTDGDDGWLEIFDGKGRNLGAARSYLEIISWLPIGEVRSQVNRSTGLPPSLRDAPKRTLWGKPLPPDKK